MPGKAGFVFQGSLTNPGPFASFDNGTESSAIGIDSTGRLVISHSATEGASSSDVGQLVVDTSGNIDLNPTSTVTISSGNLVLTTGFVETQAGVVLIGASSGTITLDAPATVSTYALEFPSSQGTSGQVLTQSGTPGILDWATPTTGTVTSVTATSPVFSSGGSTPNITIQSASGSQEGALLAADWITFNDKVSQGGNSYGATMAVGTTDAHDLELITDGSVALTIDTSGNITVDPLGTLSVTAGLTFNGSSSGSVTIDAAASGSAYDLTLPSAQGTSGQVLTQSATPGILSWTTPDTGTVTSVTASSPVASSGGSTPNITIQSASGSQEGALLAADWTTFNNKVGSVTASSPLSSSGGTTPNLTIQAASGSQEGALLAADWTTFNNKVAQGGNSYGTTMSIGTNDGNSLDFRTNNSNRVSIDTSGNLSVLGSGTIATTGGLVLEGSSSGSVSLAAPAAVTTYALTMPSAQGSSGQVLTQSGTPGILAWDTPTTGTVTSVTGTSPIASSGGSTPAISIQNATTSQTGALTSTDWNTFNNKVSDGGNSYGALMTVGTNDNHNLEFLTNGVNRLTIDTSGNLTLGTSQASIIFPSTSGTVTLKAAASSFSYTMELPATAGSSGQCLTQSSIASVLNWQSFLPLSGGTLTGSLTITNGGDLQLQGTSSLGFFQMLASPTTSNYSITMPPSQGAVGQVLTQSATTGIMQWSTPTTGTVTSVTGTSPIASSGGNTPAISIQNATTSQTGALTSTDWNTFNNKVSDGGNSYGATMSVGTNDAHNLNLLTNGTSQWTIDTAGNLYMNQNAYIQIGNGTIFLYNTSDIAFYGTSGGGIGLKAPASVTAYNISLPSAQGTANQALAQSGTPGTLTWTSFLPLSGGTLTGGLTISSGGLSVTGNTSTTGTLASGAASGTTGTLILNGSTSGSVTVVSPAAPTTYTLTLPTAVGSTGQVLSASNGTGTLTWTTATNANTASAIVERDSSGNFSAGTITASLTGHASLDLPLTGGTLSGNLTISSGGLTVTGNTSTTGTLTAGAASGTTGTVILNGSTSGSVTIESPAAPTSYAMIMPTAQGAASQVLAQSSTPGTLQWTTPVTVDTLAFTNASQAAQTVGTTAPGTQIVFNSTASPGYHLNPPNSTYSTSTGSFTPAATGYYLVLCNVQVSTSTASRTVVLYLYNNTTSTIMYSGETVLNTTGGLYQLSMSGVVNLSSADTYGIYVQASGTGVTVVAGVAYPLNYVNFIRVA